MSDITNTATIRVVADASGAEAGLRQAANAARQAGQAVSEVGAGAAASARSVDSAQRSMVAAIQRTTLAMEAGGRSTAAYYEALASRRGIDAQALAPYLTQLRSVEEAQNRAAQSAAQQAAQQTAAQQQAAESARAQAAAQRELAQAQANRDSFVAGLREQVALFGASTEEVQRYRAAQLGAARDAEPLIAQLHALRIAQEQAAAAAQVMERAQREASQVNVSRDAFLAGLREEIALFGRSADEVQLYRAAQANAAGAAVPLIAQLRALREAEEQAAVAARAMEQAQREATQINTSRDAFLGGLREQIALYGRSADEVLQYRAAQLGAAGAAGSLITQLRALREAQEQVNQAQKAQAGRDSFVADLRQQAEAIGRTRLELLELRAAQLGATNQAAPFIAQLRAAEQGMQHGGMSAAAMSAALRQVPAQMTDIIVSLQGGQAPLTVLLQQGGQLRDMFGSVGGAARALGGAVLSLINPFTLTAAAVVGLAVAYEKGHEEAIAFGRAIELSGNAAGTSVNQMADAARAISETSLGTKGAAAEVLVALVDATAVSARGLQHAADVALQMERVLGKAATDTVGEFASLRQAPLEGLQKLGEKYHFVTAATYAQVKALQDEGRQEQAAALAQSTYADEMEKRTKKVLENMGALQRGWMNVASWAKKGWDAILDIGRKETPQEEIGRINNVLSIKEAGLASRTAAGEGNSNIAKDLQEEIKQLKARRSELQAGTEEEKRAGEARERSVKAEELRKTWLAESEILLTRQDLLTRDLNKEAEKGRELGLGEEEIQNRLTVVRRKYNDVYSQGIDTSITALRQRAELEGEIDKRALAQIAARVAMGDLSEADAVQQTANIEIAALDRQKNLLQTQLGMIRTKINSQREQADLEGQIATAGEQRRSREKQQENELAALRRKRLQESQELYMKGILGATAERDGLISSLEAQFQSTQEIGLSAKQVAELRAARMDSVATLKDESAAALEAIEPSSELAKIYREQAQALRDLGEAGVRGATKQELYENNLDQLNAMVDVMSALDEAAQSAAQGMADSFGRVGSAIGGLTTALSGYGRTQAAIAAQLASTIQSAHGDPVKIARANEAASSASAQAQIKSYGDMAGAAKGFFKESSTGYKAIQAVEKAYRAAEMAMALESMATQLFTTGTVTTAKVGAAAAENAAVVSTVPVTLAAEGAKSTAYGVSALAASLSAPFPANLAAFATVAAMLAAIGVAVMGGSGSSVSLSEQRQAAQGAGTVLGDSSAKSESIARAIELSASNSSTQINYLSGMLTSLRAIESGIGNFASQLVSSTDIANPKVSLNTNNGLASTVGTAGLTAGGAVLGMTGAAWTAAAGSGIAASALASLGAAAGPVGAIAGALVGAIASKIPAVGKLMTSIVGGKQTLSDSGLTIDKESIASLLATGANARQYADIKTSGGWFGSDKNKTQSTQLDAEANRQFTSIIASLSDGIKAAGSLLGQSGDEFSARLNSFVVDIGKVSLKGLTGDEIEKQLTAVFSKLGDQMAAAAVGGLQQFQQVGEGYLETLVRVSADYAKVDASLQSIGKTFGSVGVQSIAAREGLIALMGGIDEFQSQTAGFASNFLTKAEQLAPVAKYVDDQMAALGLAGVTTREQFKGIVLSLDLTTAAGQKEYSALMALQDAFAATHAATVDLTKTEQEIADERTDLQSQLDQLTMTQTELLKQQRYALAEANRPLFDMIQAAQKLADTSSSMTKFRDAAKSLYDGLTTGSLSTLTPEQQYAELRNQYEKTKAAALGGDTAAQDAFSSTLTAFLTASQKLNSGDTQYQADFAMAQRDSAGAASWASKQVDVAQAQLNAMSSQAIALESSNTLLTGANKILDQIAQNTTPAPIQSGFVLSNALSVLGNAVKMLQESNAKQQGEVAALRQDQQAQTGDTITANAKVQQQSTQAIVSQLSALGRAFSSSQKVTLE